MATFSKSSLPLPRIYYRFPNDFTTTYPNSTSSKIVQYYQDDNWKNNNWKIKRKRERIFISPRNNIFNERNDQNHQDDASKPTPSSPVKITFLQSPSPTNKKSYRCTRWGIRSNPSSAHPPPSTRNDRKSGWKSFSTNFPRIDREREASEKRN